MKRLLAVGLLLLGAYCLAQADGVSVPIAVGPIGQSNAALSYPPIASSGGGGGATAFDAGSWAEFPLATCGQSCSSPGTGGNNIFWNHIPVGTPTCAIMLIQDNNSGISDVSSVTYGGSGMTQVGSYIALPGFNVDLSIWQLPSPLSGTQQAVVTFSGTPTFLVGNVLTFTGTGGNCVRSGSFASATSTTSSTIFNPTSSATNDVVADIITFSSGGTLTPGGSQTIRTCYNTVSTCGGTNTSVTTSTAPGAPTVSMNWASASQNYADAAVSIQHQ